MCIGRRPARIGGREFCLRGGACACPKARAPVSRADLVVRLGKTVRDWETSIPIARVEVMVGSLRPRPNAETAGSISALPGVTAAI
jgi:hypothetical protein